MIRAPAASLSRRLVLVTGLAAALAPVAAAHRSKTVLTTVEWNARTSSLEVIHRLHPHDAEVALASERAGAVVDLGDVKEQARLLLYVDTRFVLSRDSRSITLEPVGVELSLEEALVYREAKLSAPPGELLVDDRVFRDVFDDQTNLVNVTMGRGVRTLMFAGRDGPKRARNLL